MLQSKSSPEKIHPKVDKVIQELVPSEFDDFVVSIESISKALTNFAFRKKMIGLMIIGIQEGKY